MKKILTLRYLGVSSLILTVITRSMVFMLSIIIFNQANAKGWEQHQWKLELPDASYYADIIEKQSGVCGQTCNEVIRQSIEDIRQLHNESKNPAATEATAISKWMDTKLGYPQAWMWKNKGGKNVNKWKSKWRTKGKSAGKIAIDTEELSKIIDARLSNLPNSRMSLSEASYAPNSGTIELGIKGFKLGVGPTNTPYNSQTLAHEIFHAVQNHYPNRNTSQKWIEESIPEAVGFAWDKYKHGTTVKPDYRDPEYDRPLSKPATAYRRGDFFYWLGEDHGGMKYAGSILKNKITGDGIGWLDSYMKASMKTSLSKYYPEFIRDHAANKKFYKNKSYPSLEVKVPSNPTVEVEQKILRVASTYDEYNIIFEANNWESKKDKERIYRLSTEVIKADNIDDLSIILGKKKINPANKSKVALFFAEEGSLIDTFGTQDIKVTNVAKANAVESINQKFTLRLSLKPISFNLPECMTVGSKKKIDFLGDLSADEQLTLFSNKRFKISTSGGNLASNLLFTAPNSPQNVKVSITVYTLASNLKKISLGEINIVDKISDTCDEGILMTFSGSDGKLIWDANKHINALTKKGNKEYLLFKNNIAYAYTPKNGWLQIDFNSPFMKGIQGSFQGMGIPSFLTDNGGMGAMFPNVIVKKFSWNKLLSMAKKDKSVICNQDLRHCVIKQGDSLTLKYDEQYRLSSFVSAKGGANFQYGNYTAKDLPTKFSKMPDMSNIPGMPDISKIPGILGNPKNYPSFKIPSGPPPGKARDVNDAILKQIPSEILNKMPSKEYLESIKKRMDRYNKIKK